MFLRTGQGPKIRAEARNPGPGPNTAHAETASKARNPGPVSPYSKRPRLKSGALFIFAT